MIIYNQNNFFVMKEIRGGVFHPLDPSAVLIEPAPGAAQL